MEINTHRLDRIMGVLFFVFSFSFVVSAGAEGIDTITAKEIYMIKGELVNLKADGLERISVTNPEVADILKADEKEILVVGQSVGQATIFVWDKQGKRSLLVRVFSQDLELVKERLEALFKVAGINEATVEIDGREGKVVISGDIPKHKKEQFTQIVEKFGDDVLNLGKDEEIDDLIQIAVQITELSTTLSKSLGIDWTAGTATTLSIKYPETLPDATGASKDLFKLGDFSRTSALLAKVNALIAQGKARILSRPKLVVKSGEEASFLVGGEIPIRTSISTLTGGTGQITEQVTFKEYGISMTITPEVKKEKIDITLIVEIRDIDSANAVGNDVAFTSRSAQTKLYLDDGQTIVMAGLIKQNKSVRVTKVPFLGDIPVLGALFRNKSTPSDDQDQELVISLTPTVLQKNRGKILVAAQEIRTEATLVQEEAQKREEPITQEVKLDLPPAQQRDVPAPILAENAVPEEAEAATSSVAELIIPDVPGAHAHPEPVASTASASAAGSPVDIDEYVRAVQQKIAQAIIYPQEAERSGWEGTVKLSLLILSDGTLATAMIRESSGHEIFDQYTLNTARNLAPYSSFPSNVDLRELTVTIPIVYSLKKK